MFQQNINGNTTKNRPFVTADGWVWFRGTDSGLWRVFNDGTQQSKPGNNSTFAPPSVTPDGWVYFRGTNNQLWRMLSDGSQRTQLDGNSTMSTPVVAAMGIAYGVAGEWVYWRGTDDKLWRDLVPASALDTQTGAPAYYILTVAYSPPGTEGGSSGSQVAYTSGSSTGTTTTTSKSFKAETEVGASGGPVSIGGSFSAATTTTDTSALSITKSQSYSFMMPGPAKDGIIHDYDIFLLLLNPTITAVQYPQDVVLWSMGVETGTALIYSVYAGYLKGTMPMPPGLKAVLDARGLTQADYDQILATNPFSQGPAKIDPNRFLPTLQSFPYSPPPDDKSSPITFTLTMSTEHVQTDTHEVETEYTVGMEVEISFLKDESKLTWTSTNSTEKSSTQTQSASATVGGPAYGYEGPVTILVYWDALYSSFMFAFPSSSPSYTGTLRDGAGQPVAYSPVTLTIEDYQFRTLTDARGDYRFYDTPHGPGMVTFGGEQVQVQVGG